MVSKDVCKHNISLARKCKLCYESAYRKNNKNKLNNWHKKYRLINADTINEQARKRWAKPNSKRKSTQQNWKKSNILKIRENANKRYKTKYKKDLTYTIKLCLRRRFYAAIKNIQKTGSAISDLGCSIDFFKSYMESKFQPGMTWENYGKWHIDHIRPLSSFDLSDSKQLKKACHYGNLQPLWASNNIRKSNKYNE